MTCEDKLQTILSGLPFTLTDEQLDFTRKFIAGDGHWTLLGEGGTGKSTIMWVLKQYYDHEIVFGGSSGIATVNLPHDIGVATGHTLFNLSRDEAIESDYRKKAHNVLTTSDLVKIIVLDEGYCYNSQDLHQMLNQIKKLNRKTRKRQQRNIRLLLCGDPLQRLPIVKKDLKQALNEKFGHWLMFRSTVWEEANFTHYVFTEVKRQTGGEPKDIWFEKALKVLRYGMTQHYDKVLEGFNKKVVKGVPNQDSVYIAPTNKLVNTYNDAYLNRNPNHKIKFEVKFDKGFNRNLFPMDKEVTLAVGCKALCLVNNPESGYQNGTIITITLISSDGVYGLKDDGNEVFVPVHEFKEDEVYIDNETKNGVIQPIQKRRHVASAYMIPLKLCAGFVSARVQGRTFECDGLIDFGCFDDEWLYTKAGMEDFMVAGASVNFGRFTNIDYIHLKNPMKKVHIKVCRDSIAFWFECLNEMRGKKTNV
jgi:hypothetical protein